MGEVGAEEGGRGLEGGEEVNVHAHKHIHTFMVKSSEVHHSLLQQSIARYVCLVLRCIAKYSVCTYVCKA